MSEKQALDVDVIDVFGQTVARFAFAVGSRRFTASMSMEQPGILEVHLSLPHMLYLAMPITSPPSPIEFRGPAGANIEELVEATFGGPLSLPDYLEAGGQLQPIGRIFAANFKLGIPKNLIRTTTPALPEV